MSLNQLEKNSNKPWLNIVADELVIDGDLTVNDNNALPGYSLHCVSDGVAKFTPRNVQKNLGCDYFSLGLNGVLQDEQTLAPAPMPGIVQSGNVIIENDGFLIDGGEYLVILKIAMKTVTSPGVYVSIFENGIELINTLTAIPFQNTSTNGLGITSTNLLFFQPASELEIRINGQSQTTTYELSDLAVDICNIAFIKLNNLLP